MFTAVLPPQVFADRLLHRAATWRAGPTAYDGRWPPTRTSRRHRGRALLQGVGGMHAYDPACLVVLREVADEHGLVPVFDDRHRSRPHRAPVRQRAGRPDILCAGKALTGGYLTLAAVLTTGEVARGISASESGVPHRSHRSWQPAGFKVVALASLDLLERRDGLCADVARLHDGLTWVGTVAPCARGRRRAPRGGRCRPARPPVTSRRRRGPRSRRAWIRPFRDLIHDAALRHRFMTTSPGSAGRSRATEVA